MFFEGGGEYGSTMQAYLVRRRTYHPDGAILPLVATPELTHVSLDAAVFPERGLAQKKMTMPMYPSASVHPSSRLHAWLTDLTPIGCHRSEAS